MIPLNQKSFFSSVVFLFSYSLFLITPLYAEIESQDSKGIHKWIKPEYQIYSPVLGYVFLDSEEARNYRFLGNYGPKVPGHGCMDLVPNYQNGVNLPHGRMPGLIERKDCPQDFTSEWIQRLFPSHDGMVFTENSHSAILFPISLLKPLGSSYKE